jgi:hypothetical protein
MRQASRERAGPALAERLRERQVEIEEAALTRIYAVSELPPGGGPEYAEGLRAAVSVGVDYGFRGVERGEQRAPPVPEALLAQARLAARSGVSLDTVLRRYLAGHALLDDFLIEEAQRAEPLVPAELKRLLRSQAAILDRLLATVAAAYTEEAQRRPESAQQRRAERIERLLGGERLDISGLGYDFAGWHLGMIVVSTEAEAAIRGLAEGLDCRLLLLLREEQTGWAWLGARHRLDSAELLERFADVGEQTIAIGEPCEGLVGWRLTHRQAAATLPVAKRRGSGVVRYGEVALLAAVLQDDLLASSLHLLYLRPLGKERDGGAALRETLRAYLAAGRSISSAATSLGVSRRTVANRLRRVEDHIGHPLHTRLADVETALRLEQLERGYERIPN